MAQITSDLTPRVILAILHRTVTVMRKVRGRVAEGKGRRWMSMEMKSIRILLPHTGH
jgi:hypothetical protein